MTDSLHSHQRFNSMIESTVSKVNDLDLNGLTRENFELREKLNQERERVNQER